MGDSTKPVLFIKSVELGESFALSLQVPFEDQDEAHYWAKVINSVYNDSYSSSEYADILKLQTQKQQLEQWIENYKKGAMKDFAIGRNAKFQTEALFDLVDEDKTGRMTEMMYHKIVSGVGFPGEQLRDPPLPMERLDFIAHWLQMTGGKIDTDKVSYTKAWCRTMEMANERISAFLEVRRSRPPKAADTAEELWGKIVDSVDFDGGKMVEKPEVERILTIGFGIRDADDIRMEVDQLFGEGDLDDEDGISKAEFIAWRIAHPLHSSAADVKDLPRPRPAEGGARYTEADAQRIVDAWGKLQVRIALSDYNSNEVKR
jgi:hypothetical protein